VVKNIDSKNKSQNRTLWIV